MADLTTEVVQVIAEIAVIGPIAGFSAVKAWRAEKHTRPTGGNFGQDVHARLVRIERKVDRTDKKLDRHLEAHANGGTRKP